MDTLLATWNWNPQSTGGSRGPWGPAPLSPRFLSKLCSFQAIARGKPLFWAHFGLRAPPDQNPGSGPAKDGCPQLFPPLAISCSNVAETPDFQVRIQDSVLKYVARTWNPIFESRWPKLIDPKGSPLVTYFSSKYSVVAPLFIDEYVRLPHT